MKYIQSGANISSCEQYRYSLWRIWETNPKPSLNIVGLNPSTADSQQDDPTVRRCVGFAKDLGYNSLILTNLFACRTTDPSNIVKFKDPIGPKNNLWLTKCFYSCSDVVVAWGTRGSLLNRNEEVLKMIEMPWCLGTTKEGHPKHPLYLPKSTKLQAYRNLGKIIWGCWKCGTQWNQEKNVPRNCCGQPTTTLFVKR